MYYSDDKQRDCAKKALLLIGVCGCFTTFITFTVYLGIYAFSNPEAQAYYISGSDETQAELVAIVPDAEADGVIPIHDHFVTWFTWMFANQLITLSWICTLPILILFYNGSKNPAAIIFQICFSSYSCSVLIAYIMGLVWRFSKAGKFASGD